MLLLLLLTDRSLPETKISAAHRGDLCRAQRSLPGTEISAAHRDGHSESKFGRSRRKSMEISGNDWGKLAATTTANNNNNSLRE